ncbi:hypothetical protein CSKR_108208 [Clonorchis sinensis]|uniref:Uncharacterized protein n=1 Tax=Clonorchis sinensis TaxID=79923 RepID=A0A419PRK1_CLOSI|nr:hypothetical protein CSKR_108208 [Clonorchis sinensis]
MEQNVSVKYLPHAPYSTGLRTAGLNQDMLNHSDSTRPSLIVRHNPSQKIVVRPARQGRQTKADSHQRDKNLVMCTYAWDGGRSELSGNAETDLSTVSIFCAPQTHGSSAMTRESGKSNDRGKTKVSFILSIPQSPKPVE